MLICTRVREQRLIPLNIEDHIGIIGQALPVRKDFILEPLNPMRTCLVFRFGQDTTVCFCYFHESKLANPDSSWGFGSSPSVFWK